MANNTQINEAVTLGDIIATEDISGVKHELVKVEFGADGVATKVSAADPLPTVDTAAITQLIAILAKLIPAPSTEAKQTEQTVLLTTLDSLVENLNSLVSALLPLGAAMNSGQPALRTIPIASVSTAVTGTVTATVASTVVSSQTNFGLGMPAVEMANDMNNLLVTMANINNTTV